MSNGTPSPQPSHGEGFLQEVQQARLDIESLSGGNTEKLKRQAISGDKVAARGLLVEARRRGLRGRALAAIGHVEKTGDGTFMMDDRKIAIIPALELVESQYKSAFQLFDKGSSPLYDRENLQEGDVSPPSPEECLKILEERLTIDQVEVINSMEKPIFQLIPITKKSRWIKYLNGHKPMPGQQITNISEWNQRADGAFDRSDTRNGVTGEKDENITGWKIAISEGAKALKIDERWDDTNKTLEERMAAFRRFYQSKGVTGMDYERWISLMIRGFSEDPPSPIDDYWASDGTYTLLNEEEVFTSLVAAGYWRRKFARVHLFENRADRRYDHARLRPSVMVEV